MNNSAIDETLSKLVDDQLTDAERAELFALLGRDAEARREYLRYMDLHAVLSSSVALSSQPGAMPMAKLTQLSTPRARFSGWFTYAAAAVLMIVTAAVYFQRQAAIYEIALLEHADGLVSLSTSAGPVQANTAIPSGATLTVEGDSRAVITLSGSRLEIGSDSLLRWNGDNGTAFTLARGTLKAEVAPRPKSHPLRVITPQSEVLVLGTRFTVSVSDMGFSSIETEKGVVRVTRLADAQQVQVAAGEYVVATAETESLNVRKRVPSQTTPIAEMKVDAASLDFAKDGRLLAQIYSRWNWIDAENCKILSKHAPEIPPSTSASAINKSRVIFVARDEIARVADLANGQVLYSFAVPEAGKWKWALSADGAKLAAAPNISGTPTRIKVWDVDTGRLLSTIKSDLLAHIFAFSPEGDAVLIATNRDARKMLPPAVSVWNLDGSRRCTFSVPDGNLRKIEFSPDGRFIAGVCDSGAAHLWDARTGIRLGGMNASDGWITPLTAMAFSPDSRILAVGSEFGDVYFWDLRAGIDCGRIGAQPAAIRALAFSPDGKRLAVQQSNSHLSFWNAPSLATEGSSSSADSSINAQ